MRKETKKLQISQLSNKMDSLKPLQTVMAPEKGWVNAIRTGLGMSMRQLAQRMNKSNATAIQKLERNEAEGKVRLKSLQEAAIALDMKLVYAIVPISGNLEGIIENRASELAKEIVRRTNRTMILEDQKVTKKRLKKEINELTKSIIDEMPKMLWD